MDRLHFYQFLHSFHSSFLISAEFTMHNSTLTWLEIGLTSMAMSCSRSNLRMCGCFMMAYPCPIREAFSSRASRMFASTDIPSQSASGSIENICIYRHTLPVCKWKHREYLYLQTYPPSLQVEASRMFVSTDIPSPSASVSIENVCIYRHTLPSASASNTHVRLINIIG